MFECIKDFKITDPYDKENILTIKQNKVLK